MRNEMVLRVAGLDKKIGRHSILQNISFEMQQGEILGLLGPNGSGKTTLLKCIVGLLKPTKGTISIKGVDVQKHFERAIRHIGAIVENPELYDYLSGYDNLVHFWRMSPDVPEERLDEVIELLDMEEYIENKVFTYSLGMRQRLGLAQAILHRPSILLLDEPTNGLDPAGIKDLREHLRNLAQQDGVSIIISSHILAEIEQICDHVVMIDDGQLIASGSIDDFKQSKDGRMTYFFKVSDVEQAQLILQQFGQPVSQVDKQATGFQLQVTEQQAAELNQLFVQQGIRVYALERVQTSLEDAFFKKVER